MLDLGADRDLNAVLIAFMQTRPRSYTFSLYSKADAEEKWTKQLDQKVSDFDRQGFEAFPLAETTARLIKIEGHGGSHPEFSDWTNLCEVVVLGQ